MLGASIAGLDRRRLGLVLGVFFFALAIPSAILIRHAYGQLKWSAFHQQQVLAEEMAAGIDARIGELIAREEARSFTDYAFLVVEGNPAQNFVQRSVLASYPIVETIPGLIGYFQVDASGAFSTPLLPAGADATSYGVSSEELEQRRALQDRILQILSENRLVPGRGVKLGELGAAMAAPSAASADKDEEVSKEIATAPSPGAIAGKRLPPASQQVLNSVTEVSRSVAEPSVQTPQASFDELAERKVQETDAVRQLAKSREQTVDLNLDASRYDADREAQARRKANESEALRDQRMTRKERSAIPEGPVASDAAVAGNASVVVAQRVRTFESDIDPFALGLLDSGQFVLFRNAWRDGQRYIQGLLIEQRPFLAELAATTFGASALAQTSDLVVADRGNVLSVYGAAGTGRYDASAADLKGALLYQTRLSAPLNDLELIFSVHDLPPGPGAGLLASLAAILTIVLCGGSYLMYRLGSRHIALARQQQDFVSAVSHELKTPLTSIRMYGEMLRAGWGSDEQKRGYYDYIYDESERLSRLINNVLQLARMNRNEMPLLLKPVTAAELTDNIRSKVGTQIERAGFALDLRCEPGADEATVQVDLDAVLQIVINLVDNAIKFSAKAPEKRIDIWCRRPHDATLLLSVRDYGPGVPKDQTRRIFELFYRSENELTRETVGTGIGLALVHQLARAMHARVDVLNRDPGAEFRVTFPTQG
jgi:signal transduction histidine kinase